MPMSDFRSLLDRRVSRISKIFGTIDPKNYSNFLKTNLHLFSLVIPEHPLSVYDVFDETNSAIGEDWLWTSSCYYFARESDALWFTLKWL